MPIEIKNERVKGKISYIYRIAWVFGLPAIVIQIIFGWYPLLTGLIVAFFEFRLIKPSVFVGLENFKYFVDDITFFQAFRNTFYFAILSIALTFLLPILIAIFLMEMRKGIIRIMMILWFIPVASMAGVLIWKWFYHPQYGLFNGILISLGFPPSRWLGDPRIAMICLILPGLIMYGPGLIYIATLQSIPNELYEAAELEGVSFWQKIWHITLPRLRPIITMMLLLSIISNMQVFNQPFIMTGGGPNFATYTVVIYIYNLAFSQMNFGEGAALAMILSIVILIFIVLQRKYFKENIDI